MVFFSLNTLMVLCALRSVSTFLPRENENNEQNKAPLSLDIYAAR